LSDPLQKVQLPHIIQQVKTDPKLATTYKAPIVTGGGAKEVLLARATAHVVDRYLPLAERAVAIIAAEPHSAVTVTNLPKAYGL
jgi:hypothetical protein